MAPHPLSLSAIFLGVAFAKQADLDHDLDDAQRRFDKYWRLMLLSSLLRSIVLSPFVQEDAFKVIGVFVANFALEFLALLWKGRHGD